MAINREEVLQAAEKYVQDVAKSAATIGRVLISMVVAFILATVYIVDQDRIRLGAVLNDVDYQRSRYAYAYEYYKKAAAYKYQ